MLIVFYFCLAILIYVFIFYPLLVLVLAAGRKRDFSPRWREAPTATLIFSAYNEAAGISEKLENFLQIEYPAERFDLIIIDDASTDGTSDQVRRFLAGHPEAVNRIRLIEQSQRKGKTAALNRAAQEARGEVLIFTDANALFQPDAVRQLIGAFDAEGKVGVVCGELSLKPHPQALSDEEQRYWSWEIRLKRAESQLGTLLGANGSIYALRRELYEPLAENLISDFIAPLLLARRGYRTVYQPRAISIERGVRDLPSEFRRKKRIVQRSLYGLWAHRELLNPLRSGWLALQLWSHKVLRWLAPVWLVGLLVASFALRAQEPIRILLWLQVLGYALGTWGLLQQSSGKAMGILRLPAYVLMVLGASLAGVWGFISGKKVVTWEPQR